MRQRWFQWSARAIARWAFIVAGTAFSATVVNITLQAAQDTDTPPTSLEAALPANATGEQIFRLVSV